MIKGIIPYSGFSGEILKYYYSPNLIIKNSGEDFLNLYCFVAKVEPWNDEVNISNPENSDHFLKDVYKNMIALKKINSNDISPVIKRIDWKSGTIYSAYSTDVAITQSIDYYIKNSYDQVFKCLHNGTNINAIHGSQSTIQPLLDFTTNFSNNIIETGDGYVWKYLYTIDSGAKLKFYDENWIPVPALLHRQTLKNNTIGCGEVSIINVYNPGEGYSDDPGTGLTTTVTITGDGSGAEAKAVIENGEIIKIIMTNSGSNYTYADASIEFNDGYSGSGAVLLAEISPIGGHGYNLLAELGCRSVMITAEFNGTETGKLPNDIDYRQIGLVTNPETLIGSSVQFADSIIYRATHDVTVSQGSGMFQQDEIVYQGSAANPTYSGRVLYFDATNNILYLINTVGTINLYQILYGSSSNISRLALQEVIEEIIPFSGNIIYIENRTKVQRTSVGLEQFRLTLNY